jgi:hypothetical protein
MPMLGVHKAHAHRLQEVTGYGEGVFQRVMGNDYEAVSVSSGFEHL